MQELIKIHSPYKNLGRVVSARDLHQYLESGQDFSTWIKKRIEKFDFIENQDYILFHKKVEQVSGAKHLTEYAITIDMAKELAMVENNEKGKQARRYFIECEKKLFETQLNNFPQDYSSALRMLADQWDMNKKLEQETKQLSATLEENKPKIEYYEQLVDINGYTNLRDTAKLLGRSQNQFISELVGMQWLYRDSKGELKPHSDKVAKGYLTLKEWGRKLTDKENLGQKKEVTGTQTRVTQKGRQELLRILKVQDVAA